MLQSANRLRHPAEVKRVRQEGQSWRHPLLILLVQPNSLSTSRFTFVASRFVGKAVRRNRAKRLLREVVRDHLPDIQPGWDCVMIARSGLSEASYSEVDTAVYQLLHRAKLLQKHHG
ncbi:MAG: ribonuclease P protein component [Anaerolineae bacterium]|nr:ribonuclease P protein component [Anaerolineae bacterium]